MLKARQECDMRLLKKADWDNVRQSDGAPIMTICGYPCEEKLKNMGFPLTEMSANGSEVVDPSNYDKSYNVHVLTYTRI